MPGGYLLGSNRDENRLRKAAIEPEEVPLGDYLTLMPRDGKAGGTWIAARNDGWSAVLLNGAFVPHVAKPPYRHSRGAIIPQLMEDPRPDYVMTGLNLEDIEPFSLLIAGPGLLKEWRWDGTTKHEMELNSQMAYCRSSVTLYNPVQEEMRENWFRQALTALPVNSAGSLFRFHNSRNTGEKHYDIMVERPDGIETVSTTIVSLQAGEISMEYFDYLNDFSRTLRQQVVQAMLLSAI